MLNFGYMQSTERKGAANWILFILGVFCETKVYFLGALAISEMIVFPLAPILFFQDIKELKRDGFVTFLSMGCVLLFGLLVSAALNDSPWPFVIKKLATVYSIFSYFVVFHRLLRNNYKGIGWFFLGAAISSIITIYAFNPRARVTAHGMLEGDDVSLEDIMNHELFWFGRIMAFGQLPVIMEYLKTPLLYSILTPIAFTIFLLMSTTSGRSGSLIVLLAGFIVLIGGKRRQRMQIIGRHFLALLVGGLIVIFLYKATYSYFAHHKLLSESSQAKYDRQTERGSGVLPLLMAGRMEFFMAIPAILDKPILGHGIGTEDKKGYREQFLLKYGTDVDLAWHHALMQRSGGHLNIIAHSHILGAWVRYGIGGFIFYIYIFYLMYSHLRYFCSAIPQWFGYFAIFIPHWAWHILFSPFADRWQFALFVVCLLYARAIGQGRLRLPLNMEKEARKYEK